MRILSLKRGVMALAGMASGFGCAAAFTLQSKVHAEPAPHPPHLPRSHTGPVDSLDHDRHLAYRNLGDEAKAEAEEIKHLMELQSQMVKDVQEEIQILKWAIVSVFALFFAILSSI